MQSFLQNVKAFKADRTTVEATEKATSPPRTWSAGNSTAWAHTAMKEEIRLVSEASPGSRNHQLNSSAYSLGQIVGGGALNESEVADALLDAARICGLSETEANRTINSGLTSGKNKPRTPPLANPRRVRESMTTTEFESFLDQEGQVYPPPGQPMLVAERLLKEEWTHDGAFTLRRWRGSWMHWSTTHWAEVDNAEIESMLYIKMKNVDYEEVDKKGNPIVLKWNPNRNKIGDLVKAMEATAHLSSTIDPPVWLSDHGARVRPRTSATIPIVRVAGSNHILEIINDQHDENALSRDYISDGRGRARTQRRNFVYREVCHDPRFFNLVSVPFAIDTAASRKPERWLAFLNELWPNDPEAVRALREWFGYVISGRTDQHKILLITGPTRSGKGTIADVLRALIGPANVAGPTLAQLGSNFGLAPLIGKPLAVISDARIGGRDTQQIVERLLTISGEDVIDIDRKYRDSWTGSLPTRIMILSNEMPSLGDVSGAIANRFIVLQQDKSFLGKENRNLRKELKEELPGILMWSLRGLEWLLTNDRFTEPESSRDATVAMMDAASPMSAFVRECCDTGAGLEISVDSLFEEWRVWCTESNRDSRNKQIFGKNIKSVVPGIKQVRQGSDVRSRVYQGISIKPERQRSTGWSPWLAGRVNHRDQWERGS